MIVGDEIREAAAKNRTEFTNLSDLLSDLNNFCLAFVNTLEVSSSNIREIYPTALLLRSWTACQAIASLLHNGFNDDAFALIRTMLEIEFQLAAILRKPELTDQLVRENEIYRRKRLENLLEHQVELPADFQREDVEAEIRRLEQEQAVLGKGTLKKREVAELGGSLKDYDTLYSYLCDVDHVSPTGLAEYLEVDHSNGTAKLRYGTSPYPIYYAFLWTSSILLKSVAIVSSILEKDIPKTFEDLNRRHTSLWNKHVRKVPEEQVGKKS